MAVSTTRDVTAAVLVGAFNPSIFHPSWLALHELISKDALSAAETLVSHPDISRFEANHMSFDIQKTRVLISCESDKDGLVQDMVRSIFGNLLTHSPVSRVGINRTIDVLCGTEERRDELGKHMAPQSSWGNWGKEIAAASGKRHGGMQRLTMRQIPRHDGREGHFQADLQPLINSNDAIRLDFNSELVAGNPDEIEGAGKAVQLIEDCWAADLEKAKSICDEVVSMVEGF
ncbi:hypothetical protein [Roseovarius phycicola]|uniref:Uncharacterized protein n=1 Tax=Roseovarius phycicola TaxID=3080976 RepID=A0ABZ2HI37_9RHOB